MKTGGAENSEEKALEKGISGIFTNSGHRRQADKPSFAQHKAAAGLRKIIRTES